MTVATAAGGAWFYIRPYSSVFRRVFYSHRYSSELLNVSHDVVDYKP